MALVLGSLALLLLSGLRFAYHTTLFYEQFVRIVAGAWK